MKKRALQIIFSLALGLFIAGVIAAYQIKQDEKNQSVFIVAKDFGGPFTLVNQDNKTVTEKDFKNQWRLIYFGFTYCPAICPTELQKISSALKELGSTGEEITPIFISVDPERDTVNVMQAYVKLFHPRLIGLTGTPAQIDQAKKSYKIYAAKVKDETMTDYTVDHSSFIYLINPDNDLVRIFKTDDTAEDIIKITEQSFASYKSE